MRKDRIMKVGIWLLSGLLTVSGGVPALADDGADEAGFVSFDEETDLDAWLEEEYHSSDEGEDYFTDMSEEDDLSGQDEINADETHDGDEELSSDEEAASGEELSSDEEAASGEELSSDEVVLFDGEEPEDGGHELFFSNASVSAVAVPGTEDALPEGAIFKVIPVSADTEGYSYDAYLAALSEEGASGGAASGNTLLFDVAFLVRKTDEDGQYVMHEGEADSMMLEDAGDGMVYELEEVDPAGPVSVSVTFLDNQLTEGISLAEGSDGDVYALPLGEEAKAAYDTAREAEDLSADDVRVTRVDDGRVDTEWAEETTFTAYASGVYAIRNRSAAVTESGGEEEEGTDEEGTDEEGTDEEVTDEEDLDEAETDFSQGMDLSDSDAEEWVDSLPEDVMLFESESSVSAEESSEEEEESADAIEEPTDEAEESSDEEEEPADEAEESSDETEEPADEEETADEDAPSDKEEIPEEAVDGDEWTDSDQPDSEAIEVTISDAYSENSEAVISDEERIESEPADEESAEEPAVKEPAEEPADEESPEEPAVEEPAEEGKEEKTEKSQEEAEETEETEEEKAEPETGADEAVVGAANGVDEDELPEGVLQLDEDELEQWVDEPTDGRIDDGDQEDELPDDVVPIDEDEQDELDENQEEDELTPEELAFLEEGSAAIEATPEPEITSAPSEVTPAQPAPEQSPNGQTEAAPKASESVKEGPVKEGSAEIYVNLNLVGRSIEADDNFTVSLLADTSTASDGTSVATPMPETTSLKLTSSEALSFGKIHFSKAGTYQYKVIEEVPGGASFNKNGQFEKNGVVYDSAQHDVRIDVSESGGDKLTATVYYDNAETGTLTFTNTLAQNDAIIAAQEITLSGAESTPAESAAEAKTTLKTASDMNPFYVYVALIAAASVALVILLILLRLKK